MGVSTYSRTVGLVDGDLVGAVGEDHHAGLATRVIQRPFRGHVGHGHRVGRDVGEDAARRVATDLGAGVPGDHRDARSGHAFKGCGLFGGVKAVDDDPGGVQRQRLPHGGRPALHRARAVENLDFPADLGGGFLDPRGDAQDAAVLQVSGEDDDGFPLGGLGARGGAVEGLLREGSARESKGCAREKGFEQGPFQHGWFPPVRCCGYFDFAPFLRWA